MNKPLLAAGALLLGGIVTGGAIFVASSGGEEEAVQIQESASPSASVTPGSLAPSPTRTPSTSSPSSTPASSSAPTPSPPTIPDGWVLHSQQPSERSPAFSFAYPSNWFPYSTSNDVPGDGLSVSVYSFNRVEWGQPSNYPPESMKVDINVANAERVGACGPSGGEPTSLGGFPATGCHLLRSASPERRGSVDYHFGSTRSPLLHCARRIRTDFAGRADVSHDCR